MSILKRNFLIASVIYVLFYLGPILVNPLAMLNLAEATTVGLLVFGGFYLSYIFLYTNKTKLREQTKNTIITLIVMLIALFIYYNPITFPSSLNVVVNKYLAIVLLIGILIGLMLIAKNMKNSIIFIILFAPSIIQGILMRISYKAMLFYLANPNVTLYIILGGFAVYYIYNQKNK
ncbi:hypothetical protein [Gemella morbillorum]|uniref:hypothetical protein n=1 Tax=Gemella morbillorum TaxID=29391 RepID=UPI00254AAB51|nr:hypothetical protein [Gemella morbillorum]MDK8238849.1 hypothetical protein [Gemella morbillorum]MDK8255106.1 hypothetical protein [Gemella morbillorum]